MAGVIVQGLSESLSGLVLSQCAGEGAAYIMGGVYTILDMNSTIFSYGAPELSLMLAALTDIAMRGALGADLAVRVDALFDREGDA